MADYAARVWFSSMTCEEHIFLANMKINPFGLRQYNGLAIAPIHDAQGVIWNYYPIQLDCEAPWSGRLNGCYFHLGQPVIGEKIYICLDYTSAASVHMATGHQVAVVFQPENIPHIMAILERRYDAKDIVLAPDLDIDPNPIMHKNLCMFAKKHGCQYVVPKSASSGSAAEMDFLKRPLWNWNDVHRIYGLQAVSDLLAKAKQP